MNCAWNELLSILPIWIRSQINTYRDDPPQEIRMRSQSPPEIISRGRVCHLPRIVTDEDIQFCVNTASRYSPWLSTTIAQGYITAPGGNRIGLCGEAIVKDGLFCGLRHVRSICIRIAKDICGLADHLHCLGRSTLIIGAPGWGKTTLLRDVARNLAAKSAVCVIDERMELFPPGFQTGKRMDILSGCPKATGIMAVLRTMGPEYIAVDEITEAEDCRAMIHAAHCGVHLLAAAHAYNLDDFLSRPINRPLQENKVFDTCIVLRKDMSFTQEAI